LRWYNNQKRGRNEKLSAKEKEGDNVTMPFKSSRLCMGGKEDAIDDLTI
jgi:hypothetical protein